MPDGVGGFNRDLLMCWERSVPIAEITTDKKGSDMRSTACAAREEFTSFSEIETLIRGFEDGTLQRDRWTHRAHLVVASWYLICHPEEEAITRMREGIMAYNSSQGVITTPESGYHETITLFWIRVLRTWLSQARLECSLVQLINGLAENFADGRRPFRHYSKERLMSPEARAGWVEPDLSPLP